MEESGHDYGIPDLRPYAVAGRPFFPTFSPPPAFPSAHRSLTTDNLPYYMLNFAPAANSSRGGGFTGLEPEATAGRWPRQETLTLLEIRSRLDPRFKEANQKGPLWDEVSRIMCEEFGYQRSGKKCREKFENLYKYYKKTKAGRQDGKHYRFFRQLEALYGDARTTAAAGANSLSPADFRFELPNASANDESILPSDDNNNQESFVSHSSDFDTSEEEAEVEVSGKGKKKMGRKGLKARIKESIDMHMKAMMEKQEKWMEKMMMTMEENERERVAREEEWRRQEDERIERERMVWAGEKAWIQARDNALMDAFGKMVGRGSGEYYSVRSGEEWRKEGSRIGMYHQSQNDHESMSEQGTDNGNSPVDYSAVNEGGFRYFGGDHGYGRI